VKAASLIPILTACVVLHAHAQLPAAQSASAPPRSLPKRQSIDRDAFRASAREGMQALEAKDYSKAQAAFAAAIAADPTDPRAAYNRGVAAYRGDDFSVASESFAASGSSGDASLAVASMYNQGTAAFANALRMLPQQSQADGAQRPADLAPAIDALKTALTHFKDAVAADQRDLDSRFNAELAQRLLRQLEKQQEEQKDQQQKKEDEQKKEEQQNKENKDSQNNQDKQDQQQQQQQDQQEQGQDPKENDQQGQQQDQQKEQNQDQGSGEKPKDQSEKGGKGKQDAKEDPSKQDDKNNSAKDGSKSPPQSPEESSDDSQGNGTKDSAAAQRPSDAPLTREEAERLLQMVRDREKTREDAKERAKQAQPRRAPSGKDW